MRTLISMMVLGIVLVAAAAQASPTQGVVEAMSYPQLTVSGQRYTIEPETELLDRGGHRIAASDLVPGTPVELDVDDEGTLGVVKATLVR